MGKKEQKDNSDCKNYSIFAKITIVDLCGNRFVDLCGNRFVDLCGNRFVNIAESRDILPKFILQRNYHLYKSL